MASAKVKFVMMSDNRMKNWLSDASHGYGYHSYCAMKGMALIHLMGEIIVR